MSDSASQNFSERVGEKSSILHETMSEKVVKAFADSVLSQVGPGVIPPTFFTRYRKGEFELFSRLGFDLAQVLHAEQEYQYLTSVQSNSEISYQTEFKDYARKESSKGLLQFFTFETSIFVSGKTSPAVLGKTMIVVRGGK